ncbi:MAG: hypothetical protein ISS35_02105 [Kiritimatiellae bacterium]|nr:hypothetical protein [Kiritimatiellia bacterium]
MTASLAWPVSGPPGTAAGAQRNEHAATRRSAWALGGTAALPLRSRRDKRGSGGSGEGPSALPITVARGIPSASTVTAPLARLMAPVDSRTPIDIGDAPGLSARAVTAVFGWRGPCGVVVPNARSAEGVLPTVQEDACRSK